MFASLGLLCAAAPGLFVEPEGVSVDLYLIGNNGSLMTNLEWTKDPERGNPIHQLLKPELDRLVQEKRNFAVVDGGEVSAFSKERSGRFILRQYESYDSGWETTTVNGKKQTKVVSRTESEETSSGTYSSKAAMDKGGYISATFWHLRRPTDRQSIGPFSLAIQDYNSYITTRNTKIEQDRQYAGRTLMMSNNSIQQTKKLLEREAPDFNGVALCAYGLPDPSTPNLVPIPPAGMVAHYVLTGEDGKWVIRFVEYLRR